MLYSVILILVAGAWLADSSAQADPAMVALGAFAVVFALATTAVLPFLAIGLLRLRHRARIWAIVHLSLSLVFWWIVVGVGALLLSRDPATSTVPQGGNVLIAVVPLLSSTLFSLCWIAYLTRPRVAEAFGTYGRRSHRTVVARRSVVYMARGCLFAGAALPFVNFMNLLPSGTSNTYLFAGLALIVAGAFMSAITRQQR